MAHTKRVMPELSSGSMADIAFLLLTFYMMTTEIKDHKGITLLLPEHQMNVPIVAKNERNLFTIRINSLDQFMIEDRVVKDLTGLRAQIKKFVLNNRKDPALSDSPEDAVVSIKTDRGTAYKSFIKALDEAQAAYYEIYGERAGITSSAFRNLDLRIAANKKVHDRSRESIPMNISIAEPSSVTQ